MCVNLCDFLSSTEVTVAALPPSSFYKQLGIKNQAVHQLQLPNAVSAVPLYHPELFITSHLPSWLFVFNIKKICNSAKSAPFGDAGTWVFSKRSIDGKKSFRFGRDVPQTAMK